MFSKNLNHKSLLLVGNHRSDTGYAWWLMESFWAKLAEHWHDSTRVLLAYPEITRLPSVIARAPLQTIQQDFTKVGCYDILKQCLFIKRHKICAIYFSDRATCSWIYFFYKLFGVKLIVVHEHSPGNRIPVIGLKAFVKQVIHRLPWLSVDGAIGATDYVRQRLIEVNQISTQRCYSAPNGLPPVRFQLKPVDLHKCYDIPVDRKIMIMTGRAHRYKGVQFVLYCMEKLNEIARASLHFIFVGDGPDLNLFISTAQDLGLSGQCSFLGKRDDVAALLDGADFAIHASLGEVGYSLSILEYMRAGLPVIVPDNPSVCGATVHEVTGLVYPENDQQSASSMIEQLLFDDLLRQKMGAAAQLAAQHFTLEATHDALIKAMKSIDKRGVLT